MQGQSTVWIFRPEDIAEVFKADTGRYPERRSHRALYKYRIERPQVYKNGGLLPTYLQLFLLLIENSRVKVIRIIIMFVIFFLL